jgi:hypothetical protein
MTRAIGIWAALGIAVALTSRVLFEAIWVLGWIPALVWALAGLVLLALQAWSGRRAGSRGGALRRSGVILLGLLLFYPLSWVGDRVTERIRFARQRGAYDRIVAKAQGGAVTRGELDGVSYEVDPGPPVRLAFPWPGGIVDNWCGVVHDPSGDVMKVNTFGAWSDEWRRSPVTQLFGGDMFACKVMDGPYYMCCFT